MVRSKRCSTDQQNSTKPANKCHRFRSIWFILGLCEVPICAGVPLLNEAKAFLQPTSDIAPTYHRESGLRANVSIFGRPCPVWYRQRRRRRQRRMNGRGKCANPEWQCTFVHPLQIGTAHKRCRSVGVFPLVNELVPAIQQNAASSVVSRFLVIFNPPHFSALLTKLVKTTFHKRDIAFHNTHPVFPSSTYTVLCKELVVGNRFILNFLVSTQIDPGKNE